MTSVGHRLPEPAKRVLRPMREAFDSVERAVMGPARRRRLAAAVAEVQAVAPALPDRRLAEKLISAWSNRAAADVDYLLAVARHGRDATGPILECGSGLTTIVLGIYAQHPVVTLENHAGWHSRVAAALHDLELDRGKVSLVLAPLEDFGEYSWYAPSSGTIPEAIAVVVCDGPPGRGRPGGRVGLLPQTEGRLAPGALVLCDAQMQKDEETAIAIWQKDHGLVTRPSDGTELVLVIPE